MGLVAKGLLSAAAAAAALAVAAAGGHASSAACSVRGPMPDPVCTPGRALRGLTAATVCRPGYAGSVRNVPESRKREVYARYGIAGSHHGRAYEVDHLVSLELGGSNVIENLWPEAARPRPGYHEKDRVENDLHRRVCSGEISLRTAQRLIRHDWLSVYRGLSR